MSLNVSGRTSKLGGMVDLSVVGNTDEDGRVRCGWKGYDVECGTMLNYDLR